MWISGLNIVFAVVTALASPQTKPNEFVFNNNAEPESIDPAVSSGVPDNNIVIQIFEGLMAREADWATLRPGMAESYDVSSDLKTYTFKIRENAKWSDGSPLTAKDFEYSWLRAMRPEVPGTYKEWLTKFIVGAEAYSKKPTPALKKAVGVKALDARRLEVKLVKPVPYFIQLTAESIFYPVKKSVVEKHGDAWTRAKNIVSNGPFKLTEWAVQQRIVMQKNPHYYDAKDVKLEKVVALPIDDRQTAVNMFRQGKLDWSGKNGAPNGLVPAFKKDPNFRVSQGFVTYYYWFNTTRKPLDDIRVRQALALAVDRQQLVDKVTRGGEVPVTFLVPPGTGNYTSPSSYISNDMQRNLDRARKLLADAGYPGGKGMRVLNLLYNSDENHKRIAQALQQMWKKNLGINVQPFNQEWKVYLKTQKALEFDISRAGWAGDYPDPVTFLELAISSNGNNHSGWKNATYDKLLDETNKMKNGPERLQKLQQAEKILIEATPLMPLYNYVNFGFLRPEVKGFDVNPLDRPFMRYLSKK